MSKFKKEVRGALDQFMLKLSLMHQDQRQSESVIKALEKENKRLEDQNERLLDRVMSVDYAKLATYTPQITNEIIKDLPDHANEDMAGEILSVPEGEE